jgi:hypothetical protein
VVCAAEVSDLALSFPPLLKFQTKDRVYHKGAGLSSTKTNIFYIIYYAKNSRLTMQAAEFLFLK